jgi:glucose-6-phosphate 1-dehydrogenase
MTTMQTRPETVPPGVATPDDHVIVLFGSTGDLARRKLLPGLFHLSEAGLLPAGYRIIGTSRKTLSDDEFRAHARSAVDEFGRRTLTDESWEAFAANLHYASSDASDASGLAGAVAQAREEIGGEPRILHYLSVPPKAFAAITQALGANGLTDAARVILEKPFGTDLASAKALNDIVHEVFDESQIFRIDHFLGKESVQNILALRFANGLFEPVWNREHVDHVQIDVPETLSIGSRAGFYEGTGAFRDMIVTHLFQALGFVAMEAPASLDAKTLVDEKVKVFNAMKPLDPARAVRGRYEGYLDEDGVAPDSETETFVALEVEIANDRWAGVPFYLRTGKQLAQGRRVVAIAFKEPERQLFPAAAAAGANELVFEIAEPGAIRANFLAKVPGATIELGPARMEFRYESSFCAANQLEAYERLIHDAMIGDRTLFTRADGIERLWEIATPLLENPPAVLPYAAGSWGPDAVHDLIAPRRWHLPDEG